MKKLIFALLLITQYQAFPQESEIQAIRKIYSETQNWIKECTTPENCSLYKNALVINEIGSEWRAVGNFSKTISFWYTDDAANCDDCGLEGRNVLRKIIVEEVSGIREYYYEYLYFEGELIFHYMKDPEQEYRYYFFDEFLIRYMEDQEITDDTSQSESIVKSEGKRLMELFLRSF